MGTLDDIKNDLAAQAAAQTVPSRARAAIGDSALASQRVRLSEPYYSAISFDFVPTQPGGAGTLITYTMAQGQQAVAFGYALNDIPNAGGFTQTAAGQAFAKATLDMTNIREKGKPNAGETCLVYGMSVMPWEDSDARLLKLCMVNVSCARIMNGGKQRYEMGRITFMPGSGGLTGLGTSFVSQPPVNRAFENQESPGCANGLQGRDNMYVFPEPWYWRPAGNTDTDLNIVFFVERAIVQTALPIVANTPAGAFNPAFAPPVTQGLIGTYVRFSVLLWSIQDASRSVNA